MGRFFIGMAFAILALVCAEIGAFAAPISLTLDPKGPIVLGEVEQVTVTISAPETPDTANRPLRVSVNVGSFGPVKRIKPGVYRTIYTPPQTRFPQVALVAVWRETGPDAPISFLRIPLSGRTKVPVRSKKNAEIRIVVGDQTYGPVKANKRGKALIPIAVPPGVKEVVATSSRGTSLSQGTVRVNVPPYNRLTMAVTPYLVRADGQSSVSVHVYYDSDDPPPINKVRLKAGRGELQPEGANKKRYRFRYTPKRGTTAETIDLEVAIKGDRKSKAKAMVTLGIPVPERIVARGLEKPLVASGKVGAPFRVLVIDRLGLGVPDLTLTATTKAARVESIRDIGKGEYQVMLSSPAVYPKEGEISLQMAHTQGPITALLKVPITAPDWPTSAAVEVDPIVPIADGKSPFMVKIMAYDAAGEAYAGGKLALFEGNGKRPENGSRIGDVKDLGGGQYEAQVIAESGADEVDLLLTDQTGNLEVQLNTKLRSPPAFITVGARAGGIYNARFTYTFGLEAGWRPPWFGRSLNLNLALTYRAISRNQVEPRGADVPPLNAKLTLLPITLSLAYDLFAGQSFHTYAGAGFELVPYAYRVDGSYQGRSVYRGLAPGGAIHVGAAYEGLFLELIASYTAISEPSLVTPGPAFALLLGYRLGVL